MGEESYRRGVELLARRRGMIVDGALGMSAPAREDRRFRNDVNEFERRFER